MTTLYLIRHAEAEGNLYRRMHGQFDTKITPSGVKQIQALAQRFADIPIDACYASDLLRTRTTAQAICRPKNLLLQTESAFRELKVGIWEDLDFGWLHTFEPEAITCFSKDPAHWHVDGSEPFSDYTGRFIKAMTRLALEHDGETVAIFSHAAVMRGVIMVLFPDQPMLPTDNTAVTRLEYENGTFRLCYLNDNSHLAPEISTLARSKMGIGRNSIWFQAETPGTFTVMSGREVAGVLHLRDVDADTGCVDYMKLLPQFRGRSSAVQLLGRAVFTFREQGKQTLLFRKPENRLNSLCRRMELEPDENGICRMDIRLQMPELGM